MITKPNADSMSTSVLLNRVSIVMSFGSISTLVVILSEQRHWIIISNATYDIRKKAIREILIYIKIFLENIFL